MLRSSLVFSLALFATTTAVQAEDQSSYYVKGIAGFSALQDSDVTIDGTTNDLSYGADIAAGGAVGHDYATRPFRTEIEFMWRTGQAEDVPVDIGSGGNFASTSLMLPLVWQSCQRHS